MDKIGHREVVEFAGYLLNEETLIMNYITMAIVILIAVLASRNLKEVPTGWQNAIEAIAEVWEEKINTMIGPTGRSKTSPCMKPTPRCSVMQLYWEARLSRV